MSRVIDNMIAYRVLSMLVRPFNETDAYKLGIIDAEGKLLIKPKDFDTVDQKEAYTYLDRLAFNLKRLIGKMPGGENRLKNMVAALYLIKESYPSRKLVAQQQVDDVLRYLENGVCFAEEQIMVERFLQEDAPVNVTGAAVSTDIPVKKKAKIARRKEVVNVDVS